MKTILKYSLFLFSFFLLLCSCKKTSEGETVAVSEKAYKVEMIEYERDLFSNRLIEKRDTKEFKASDDDKAAEEGFLWYLASIKTFSKLNESSNGKWISIPKFYSVYDEDGMIISRIKGEEKQRLINMALTEEDIKAYKENLPPYHFEYSALVAD